MDRSSILRASTIPFVRKASLMSEAFFMDARKGCPKLHRRSCEMCKRADQISTKDPPSRLKIFGAAAGRIKV